MLVSAGLPPIPPAPAVRAPSVVAYTVCKASVALGAPTASAATLRIVVTAL